MLRNYISIAFRQIRKNKLFSFVNFAGLTLGLTFCFLTFIWYRFEHSYDRHYPTTDRLYRLNYELNFTGSAFTITRSPAPFAPMLPNYFPEIEQTTRFYPRSISVRVPGQDQGFEVENAFFADSTTMQVFGFETLQGDPDRALHTPFSIVLTDKTALRFFGKEDCMGKQLMLANQGPFTVGGVIRALPENAHFTFDFLAPFRNIADVEPDFAREGILDVIQNNKLASYATTYVLLKKGAKASSVNARFKDFVLKNGMKEVRDKQNFALFPVRDIHLQSTAEGEVVPTANPDFLQIFSLIGVLILAIAVVNFINLSTAAQLSRAKEVGVRKVLGSKSWQIVCQLLTETFLLGLPAFLLALLLTKQFLGQMETFFGRKPDFSFVQNAEMLLLFFGVFTTACLLAGVYPAVFASHFKATDIFRGKASGKGQGGNWLTQGLITLQFTVAVALLAGAGIVLRQIDYLKNRPLGFNRDMTLAVPLFSQNMNNLFSPGDQQLRNRTNAFEEKLLQNPSIRAVTLASNLPGMGGARHPIATEKIRIEDGVVLPGISVDYDFIKTFDLKIVAGRDFDKTYGTDHLEGFIINNEAVKALHFGSPQAAIGQNIQRGGKKGRVVGVVNDFHSENLRTGLSPLFMEVSPGTFSQFGIKISSTNIPATLAYVEKTWKEFFPEKVFEHRFLDESLADSYREESRFASLIGLFAGVAIFLSCFGLFGMIAFVVRQRTKEIGIRKVLGASVGSVVTLLSADFIKLIFVAILIASPIAYFFLNKWLANFAYRITIQWWIFAVAGLVAIIVALFTISFHSIKAALANPVKSLKTE